MNGIVCVTELLQTMNTISRILPVASDCLNRCELIVTAARPSLRSPSAPAIRWDGLASQTTYYTTDTYIHSATPALYVVQTPFGMRMFCLLEVMHFGEKWILKEQDALVNHHIGIKFISVNIKQIVHCKRFAVHAYAHA